ncbi:MAG TPA: HD domain-containing phosphohydrolase [Planctomycetota bacterium]|nr:HD domain-containing phosphohydrolase [Planctomycetota bacterium]
MAVHRILAIDDEDLVRRTLRDLLTLEGHDVVDVADGETALEKLALEAFDVVLCDLSLPGIGGAALIESIRAIAPTTPIVALTGFASIDSAVRSMRAGANDYATKPLRHDDLAARVANAIQRSRRQLSRRSREVRSMFLKSIRSLVATLEAKDPYTKNHSMKVAALSDRIAAEMHFSPEARRRVRLAALLHDVGKIGIPERILHKNGSLTPAEYEQICEHPLIGERILQPVMRSLPDVVAAVKHEHERFDGRGYPSRLKGAEIPIASRIIMVADCHDAITSDRPYRDAQADDVAFDVIERGAGTQFDPDVAAAFLRLKPSMAVRRDPAPASPAPDGLAALAPAAATAAS